jgi:hypothetical protein
LILLDVDAAEEEAVIFRLFADQSQPVAIALHEQDPMVQLLAQRSLEIDR